MIKKDKNSAKEYKSQKEKTDNYEQKIVTASQKQKN